MPEINGNYTKKPISVDKVDKIESKQVIKNDEADNKKDFDLGANPAELIGRSQVKNKKIDNVNNDMEVYMNNPEIAKRVMEISELMEAEFKKKGLAHPYEKACTAMPVIEGEFCGYWQHYHKP